MIESVFSLLRTFMERKIVEFKNSKFAGNIIQGDAENVNFCIDSGANVMNGGDVYNVGQAGAVGANASSDHNYFVQGDKKQTLAEAALEIQKLLQQLDRVNPNATTLEKITYVGDEVTPSFKRRVVSAMQSGGETALEEILDNSYVNVAMAIVKGWMQADQ
jgi:hypothetical protein